MGIIKKEKKSEDCISGNMIEQTWKKGVHRTQILSDVPENMTVKITNNTKTNV